MFGLLDRRLASLNEAADASTREHRCERWFASQVGKGYAGRAAKASGKKEALALAEEGGEALAAVFTKARCSWQGFLCRAHHEQVTSAAMSVPICPWGASVLQHEVRCHEEN